MNGKVTLPSIVTALLLRGLAFPAAATDIPAQLPAPDGKAGNFGKPVKVYILAGQSNMVGMGDIGGARPLYPSVMLSADPAIIPGSMPIGGSALAAHGVYRSVDPKAEKGASVSLFESVYDLPPLKDGHRYRIRVAGSAHNNMGEGYAIYVNGKLLAENKSGVVAWRKEGRRPRGGYIYSDFRDEFKGVRVTIAVGNFPMDNRPEGVVVPPGDALSVWMEEMKLPPLKISDEP